MFHNLLQEIEGGLKNEKQTWREKNESSDTYQHSLRGKHSLKMAFLEYGHLDETLQEFIIKRYFNAHLVWKETRLL